MAVTGSIMAVFGKSRTGKSYLCHTICVNCLRSVDEGGANGKALYIDAEGSFNPGHIKHYGLNLNNIGYVQVQHSQNLMNLMVVVVAMSLI
jgi:DNA repair protein RAD51